MLHELKILPFFYQEIVNGNKNFESRKNDRDFKVNDILLLREFDFGSYTGRRTVVKVTYILDDSWEQVKPGYAILAIQPCSIIDLLNVVDLKTKP